MREEFLLEAIGLIDDELVEEAREDWSGRHRNGGWQRGLAAVACLVLAFGLTTFPLWAGRGGSSNGADSGNMAAGDSNGSHSGFLDGGAGESAEPGSALDAGSTGGSQKGEQAPDNETGGAMQFPGEIQSPVLWWQGRAYACIVLDRVSEDMSLWTALGELRGTSPEEGVLEDLWLYADFGAVGTVYSSEAYPDILLAEISVVQSGETCWVQFVLQAEQGA